MLVWLSVWSEVQTYIWPSWCHCHSISLASVKFRLVLPFWYRLTRVVPEKGPLNVCVCVRMPVRVCVFTFSLRILSLLARMLMCIVTGCRLTDNLPCSTKFVLKNNEEQHEHGYRLGAVINDKVLTHFSLLHPACRNWVMMCCCGYLSGAICRLFAYGPADATLFRKPTISCIVYIQIGFTFQYFQCLVPSVLWCCWLGDRKGIRPVKNLSGEVLAWLSMWSEMLTCIWPSWCHCHSLSLASVKSRLFLPFYYRLTRVVPEKGPLNDSHARRGSAVCCWRVF